MEDCLHTSSENLSKLVSWAHSHGTICSLIPNLKHLLSEGSHGNLTAMWGCSAGHAYHWPLTATCRTGSQERMCFQDNRSFNSDSPSITGVPSETQTSPLERHPGRIGKTKLDIRTRDSCDFSYCSEPSELDDPVEEYEDEATLFDMVCESSATEDDSDLETHAQRSPHLSRKRPGMGQSTVSGFQISDENSDDVFVKKIKQEIPEDYYIVANAELTGGIDGPALALTHMSKPKPQSHAGPSFVGPPKCSTQIATSLNAELDLQSMSASPPVLTRPPPLQKPARTLLPSQNKGPACPSVATQQVPIQMPVSTSSSSQPISIPLSALQIPGQDEQAVTEELLPPVLKPSASCELAASPSVSAEPEVSSSQQLPSTAPISSTDTSAQSLPDNDVSTEVFLNLKADVKDPLLKLQERFLVRETLTKDLDEIKSQQEEPTSANKNSGEVKCYAVVQFDARNAMLGLSDVVTSIYTAEEMLQKKKLRGKPNKAQSLFHGVIRHAAEAAQIWKDAPQMIEIPDGKKEAFFQVIGRVAPQLMSRKREVWQRLGQHLQNRRKYLMDKEKGKRMVLIRSHKVALKYSSHLEQQKASFEAMANAQAPMLRPLAHQ
ncbi:uncharacterized protein KIAA1958 homolog isoform X3 [Ambystoma mexicanum]|uniref:uncharacterized protein KIAA1958 homolog isoform X3 n=1 Tax=Ambystoma mexicanum TaxID=8296 RepID=UPI0037E96009